MRWETNTSSNKYSCPSRPPNHHSHHLQNGILNFNNFNQKKGRTVTEMQEHLKAATEAIPHFKTKLCLHPKRGHFHVASITILA